MQKQTQTYCREYGQLTRRQFMSGGMQSAAAMLFGRSLVAMPSWMPQVALADPHVGPRGDTLVCIFLRGGADGLNIVVPHGDADYYAQRPTLNIPRPDDAKASLRALNLDGFFGLHPSLSALMPLYLAGNLTFVHATGSSNASRSHFEAQAVMEQGAEQSAYSGWLARHLATLDTGNVSPVRAVGVGSMLQMSLMGSAEATLLQSLDSFGLHTPHGDPAALQSYLSNLYTQPGALLSAAADRTLATIDLLASFEGGGDVSDYGDESFGKALGLVSQLIGEDVGVEVACIDYGGWDTHAAQGNTEGQLAGLLDGLGRGLATFYEDTIALGKNVTVVVMSEFGRRLQENGSGGTDHGHGNMMMVLGNGIKGKQVISRWPGLTSINLDGGRDLAITTDYRNVLGEILQRRLNNPQIAAVFPAHTFKPIGLF